MRHLIIVVLVLAFATSTLAQTDAPDIQPVPDQAEQIQAALLAAERAEAAALAAESAVADAKEYSQESQRAVEIGFNLLGLFEALSFIVTVVGGAAALFGFTRFLRAQQDLNETRQRVERELEESRRRFDEEVGQRERMLAEAITERERQLQELRSAILAQAEEQKLITQQGVRAQALLPLGERQYRASDYQGALNTYRRALELDPQNPVTHQRLGYVYTHADELDEARHHYEQAIAIEEDFAAALAGLGFVYRRMAEKLDAGIERDHLFNQSEDRLLRALKLSPKLVDDDGESWWGVLGGLYKRRGQLDQAIYAYEQVTLVTPNSSYGFGNLAWLYRQKQQHAKMLETYAHVERLALAEAQADVDNYWGFADLTVARYALGKWQEAEEVLPNTLSAASPDSPYMLPSLISTLQDMIEVLEPEKIPPIERAITRIQAFIDERANRALPD